MKSIIICIITTCFILLSCGRDNDNQDSLLIKNRPNDIGNGLNTAEWFALGDSDFDSYQADDRHSRVNSDAVNGTCVLSPIEVQARDGRDFGRFRDWGGSRRYDYERNYSLSGSTVRSSLYDWHDMFREDWLEGLLEIVRDFRNKLLGYDPPLGRLLVDELRNKANRQDGGLLPVVVQINLGINDIDGSTSLYHQFTSHDSHIYWVNQKTEVINKTVDNILDAYPYAIVVIWELLDDGGWDTRFSIEQEQWITSHTQHWNNNLHKIAESKSSVVVFETNKMTREWIGRKSNGSDKDIMVDGIYYYRDYVPAEGDQTIDNTKYIATRDRHGNTVLSALYTKELYGLLNNRFGAGLQPFADVHINAITCQSEAPTHKAPSLEIPGDVVIRLSDLPYSLGKIHAYDSNGKDISDSAVAISDIGGALYGDGQNIQMRQNRHNIGSHRIIVQVRDANGRAAAKSMTIEIQ